MTELKTTQIYDEYWQFASKRQNIFFSRMFGEKEPWTNDPILQTYKFTNVYRASDRVSQFLIRNVIYSEKKFSPEDMCFRILLFKMFNRIETWLYLEDKLGEISYSTYAYDKFDKYLKELLDNKKRMYSAAYIMPSGKESFGYDQKYRNNLKLLEYMMQTKLTRKIANVNSLKELYKTMAEYPTLGPFLAFQFSIDLNYSELCDFSEMSFVVAGPGAQNGILKCFEDIGTYSYEDIIKYVAENQEKEFEKRNIKFKSLFGRKMQLIDCQNLFCEIDKYSRVAFPDIEGKSGRTRIKQKYVNRKLEPIQWFYPPKWEINQQIDSLSIMNGKETE